MVRLGRRDYRHTQAHTHTHTHTYAYRHTYLCVAFKDGVQTAEEPVQALPGVLIGAAGVAQPLNGTDGNDAVE